MWFLTQTQLYLVIRLVTQSWIQLKKFTSIYREWRHFWVRFTKVSIEKSRPRRTACSNSSMPILFEFSRQIDNIMEKESLRLRIAQYAASELGICGNYIPKVFGYWFKEKNSISYFISELFGIYLFVRIPPKSPNGFRLIGAYKLEYGIPIGHVTKHQRQFKQSFDFESRSENIYHSFKKRF